MWLRWLTVAALWLAAVQRGVLVVRERVDLSQRRSRVAQFMGITGLAFAGTFFFARDQIDFWLGVPNFTNLLNRLALVVSLASTQAYLAALARGFRPGGMGRWLRWSAGGGPVLPVAVASAMVACWAFGPFHEEQLLELDAGGQSLAVQVYGQMLYAYVLVVLVEMGRAAWSGARELGSTDRAGTVCAVMVTAGAVLGFVVIGSFAIELAWSAAGSGHLGVGKFGSRLFPVPLFLVAAGWLSVPVTSAVERALHRWRLHRRLLPLWRHVTSLQPEIVLVPVRMRTRWLPSVGSTQRQLAELEEGLELVRVPASTMPDLDAVASALLAPVSSGGVQAADLLPQSCDRQAVTDQLVSLAGRFASARRHARRGSTAGRLNDRSRHD